MKTKKQRIKKLLLDYGRYGTIELIQLMKDDNILEVRNDGKFYGIVTGTDLLEIVDKGRKGE